MESCANCEREAEVTVTITDVDGSEDRLRFCLRCHDAFQWGVDRGQTYATIFDEPYP